MKRFWVFPLVLGVVSAVFVVAAVFEGAAPLLPFAQFRPFNVTLILTLSVDFLPDVSIRPILSMATWPGLVHVLLMLMARGVGVGALIGLSAGILDAVHNGTKPRSRTQLGENIAWCVLYAHAIIGVNVGLLSWWIVRDGGISSVVGLALGLPALLWLLAIVWGTLRTIASDDVLTPRVLLLKLRRSSALEN